MKVVTAIQARTSSSRLPNKVLFPLCGEPLLIRMIERITRASLHGTLVVATSLSPEDDIIEELCVKHGIHCFRGSMNDLLDRHYQLACKYEADALVKIPSDCPLIDPLIIDRVIGHYLRSFPAFDYVSNLHPATYPDGNDVEIMSVEALKNAWSEAGRDLEREHTTPYIWENPSKFNIGNVIWPTDMDLSTSHRFTIDYLEDYQFINEVYNRLYRVNPEFDLNDILLLLEMDPRIQELNKMYAGRYWYENHLNELKTIITHKIKSHKHED
jgi:spore coat polysaccharide biosynthesis protein SpsF